MDDRLPHSSNVRGIHVSIQTQYGNVIANLGQLVVSQVRVRSHEVPIGLLDGHHLRRVIREIGYLVRSSVL